MTILSFTLYSPLKFGTTETSAFNAFRCNQPIPIFFIASSLMVISIFIAINEEAMKKIGIGWLQRKALKALVSVVPNFKGEYKVKDNLVIVYEDKEPNDTIRISPDGKQLYGKMDDTKYTVTRIK